jgi:hypothetical protein
VYVFDPAGPLLILGGVCTTWRLRSIPARFVLTIRRCAFCFESQELRLGVEAAGKAGQRSIRADDAMTRTTIDKGFLPLAAPTARTAFAEPMVFAK